jgi:NitT/TauT family transport system substrate-binding protein
MHRLRRLTTGLVFAALAAILAASAAASTSTRPATAAHRTAVTYIKVGTSPTISNVSLYQAIINRNFAKKQIGVLPQVVTSGAQALPLLLNGQIQFTAADPVGALSAISRGIPVKIVATGQVGAPTPKYDTTGVLVKSGSGITGAATLAGKTIAVNAIGGLAQIATADAMDKTVPDSSARVKWVVLPIPDMEAAVQNGTVDAAVLNEPFVTQATQDGLKNILRPVYKSLPGVPMLVYLASTSYIQSNAAIVNLFRTSLTNGNAYLWKHQNLIRSVAKRSTTTPANILAKMALPAFSPPSLNRTTINKLMQLMIKYKVLSAPVDLDSAVYTGG